MATNHLNDDRNIETQQQQSSIVINRTSFENSHIQNDSKILSIVDKELSKHIARWRRFNSNDIDNEKTNWILIQSDPKPSDIIQGLLGNCWLLSALTLVVQNRYLLSNVLPTSSMEFGQSSRCEIRLFLNGRWHSVIVDDWLPCDQCDRLVFSEAKRNQLFVPLIEKAMAKLLGGYHRLIGGHSSLGLTCLTGYPCQVFSLPSANYPDPLSIMEFWTKILSFNSARFLMTVSCGRNGHENRQQEEQYKRLGLLLNHAYSILDIVSIGNLRLVKLRNPWGTIVWNGDWSEQSPLWTTKLLNRLETKGHAEDGIFWISFDDLCQYFQDLVVCKILPNWHQYSFDCDFSLSFEDHVGKVFEISVEETDEISCHSQVMCSFYAAKQENDQNPSSSILLVYELLPNQTSHVLGPFVSASVGTIHSSIICEAEIQQGRRYLLAVFSFDGNSTFGSNVLRIHSSRRLRFKMFEPNSALRGDLIIHYVLACGRPYEKGQIVTYHLNRKFPGLVSLVENRNAQHWIQVSMKARWKYSSTALIDQYERFTNDDHHVLEGRPATSMTKSANHCLSSDKISSLQQSNSMMITSRGSLQTVDLIAPGYCQLINMIVDSSQQFSHNHRHISIAMNFKYRSIGDKINDYMSISHEPDIGLTYGLHSARPIIINKNK